MSQSATSVDGRSTCSRIASPSVAAFTLATTCERAAPDSRSTTVSRRVLTGPSGAGQPTRPIRARSVVMTSYASTFRTASCGRRAMQPPRRGGSWLVSNCAPHSSATIRLSSRTACHYLATTWAPGLMPDRWAISAHEGLLVRGPGPSCWPRRRFRGSDWQPDHKMIAARHAEPLAGRLAA